MRVSEAKRVSETCTDNLTMPRRAYPYGRTSDPKQSKGDGHARQDDFAAEITRKEGWCLDDTYHFADRGRSGFHGEHLGPKGELTRFIAMVKAGTITPGSVLAIENLDRLSRQDVDLAYDVFRDLLRRGIWIATKTPERIYRKENNSFMDLMEPIWLFYLAHQESLKKSVRIADKWERRRERARESGKPHGAMCPAWVELGPDGYRLNQQHAATVREIYRMAREGLGVHRIAQILNAAQGSYPPMGRSPSWCRPYVRKILRTRTALGEYQPHTGHNYKTKQEAGEPIAGYYPAVVSEDEWRLAQAAIDGRTRRSGRPALREATLFTGLVTEGVSREPMCVQSRSADGTVYRYMVSRGAAQHGRQGRSVPYEQFERGVLRSVNKLTLQDVLTPDAAADARERRIAELRGLLPVLDHRLEERGRELDTEDDDETRKQLKASIRRMGEEKKAARKELESLHLESLTGRGESLAEVQSIIKERARAARDRPQEVPALNRRLKAALRWVVEDIWLVVQPITGRSVIAHVQVYLRNGERRYEQVLPIGRYAKPPQGVSIWQLKGHDFRAGDVGDAARDAEAHPQIVG